MAPDLTPVRIRGKRKRKGTAHSQKASEPSPAKRNRPSALKSPKIAKLKKSVVVMPTLQGLPQELLEIIFLYSMSIALPRASPDLGRKLSSKSVCMQFCMQSFFDTRDPRSTIRETRPKVHGDPSLQSEILACRFFTWSFFLSYVEKAHDALIQQRGKGWAKTGVIVPDASYFDRLWPYKFTQITYLGFAEGFYIPEKLLHGPWTAEKASLLYVLISFSGEIDWEASMAGETAKEGMKEAIKEENEHAVAALAVLLGISKAITTDMICYAVIHCGCNINIIRHLLFNSQILYSTTPKDTLDFHDPRLWQWADRENHDGVGTLLKVMLKKAETFSLEFYMRGETDWARIVPFPYGGSKFDARSAFDEITRELLTRLYHSYGRRITRGVRRRYETPARVSGEGLNRKLPTQVEMGDADITTSQWRLVEVGRVVLFGSGPYQGRIAAIVEIIDHKRVLVDGPASDKDKVVPRHSASLSSLSLTPIVIPKLPRATGNGVIKSLWEKEKVEGKFAGSNWAKGRAQFQKRKQLNDFDRFKVMKLRKQARYQERKALAKVRAKA
ncbi:hypothetical protein K469DRAFT_742628 [Zopfia rhizophila CBS 207.26]|uniref:Large ribosomal subunit protein eL14 domain-containing protein n=1 Tax=Zopfia rhizophila CBS 207.26 TaxID=1314779 RepID=A0A6A6DG36_9PEZI|nr:hypothetical protein K469DRAFT_742628 [Zopfia rhizophila CBS 207.26]